MTDPIIKEVLELISKSDKSVTKIEEDCGFGYRTISRWRTKNGANLYNVQAVLNYLGYKLSIEKLSEAEKSTMMQSRTISGTNVGRFGIRFYADDLCPREILAYFVN